MGATFRERSPSLRSLSANGSSWSTAPPIQKSAGRDCTKDVPSAHRTKKKPKWTKYLGCWFLVTSWSSSSIWLSLLVTCPLLPFGGPRKRNQPLKICSSKKGPLVGSAWGNCTGLVCQRTEVIHLQAPVGCFLSCPKNPEKINIIKKKKKKKTKWSSPSWLWLRKTSTFHLVKAPGKNEKILPVVINSF